MGQDAVRFQKQFVELFHAELVLDRAAKHLLDAISKLPLDGWDQPARAHKLIGEKLLAVQLERDALLAEMQKEER
jgi:hypothetical protein